MQLLLFKEEFLVSASPQLELITSLPFVHSARRSSGRCGKMAAIVNDLEQHDVESEAEEGEAAVEQEADEVPPRRARRARQKKVSVVGEKKVKKNKDGRGTRYCRACGKFKKSDEFPAAHSICWEDKRALDNLAGYAKRQNKKEWFAKVKMDETRLQKLIKTYHEKCPESGNAGSRGKFFCAEYSETHEASTEVLTDEVGEMMFEDEFLDWCRTLKGGRLSSTAAQLKWNDMKEHPKDFLTDHKGPGGQVRFRVAVKDVVTFRNAYRRRKEVSMRRSAIKNPDADGIDKLKRDLMLGHESMGPAGEDSNLMAIAKNMVGTGAGTEDGTFNGAFMHGAVGDVQDLLTTSDEEQSDNDADEDAASDPGTDAGDFTKTETTKKSSASSHGKPSSAKKAVVLCWNDRENDINKAQRVWRAGVAILANGLEASLSDADAVLLELRASWDDLYLKNAYRILEFRVVAAKLVVQNNSTPLAELIAAISASEPMPAAAAALGFTFLPQVPGDAATSPIGPLSVPKLPCAQYKDFRTVEQMGQMTSEYEAANMQADIKVISNKLAVFKVALNKLLGALKAAIAELKKAQNCKKAATEQSEAEKKRKSGAAPAQTGKKGKIISFMELIATSGHPLVSFPADAAPEQKPEWLRKAATEPVECSEPYIVTAIQWVTDDFQGVVRSSLDDFGRDFAASSMRRDVGRGQRPSEGPGGSTVDANDFLLNRLAPLHCPGAVVTPGINATTDDEKTFKENLGLFNFAVRNNSAHSSMERGSLWSGRLSLSGAREVAMVPLHELQEHMRKSGIIGVEPRIYFRDMRVEGIKKAQENGVRMYFGTVGAGEYLFTPSHFLVREAIKDKDCLGLRYSMILKNDKKGMKAFADAAASPATLANHPSKGVVRFGVEP